MKKWQTAVMASLLCLSMLLIVTPLPTPQVEAASALSIEPSIQENEVYTGHHSSWTIGDRAYVVSAIVTSGGSPVTDVSVVADVTGPNGELYWLRDGTQVLYDTVQGKGMDQSGWVSGPTYGGTTNDGIYANFLELNNDYFGNHAGNWTIRLTASKQGYNSASTELTLNIVRPTTYTHRFNLVDLDTSTAQEDWVVYASPGQTFNAKLVYDEVNVCPAGCIFYMRAYGCPYESWGNSYDIDSGSTGYRSNVERTWTYTVPSTPGIYTLTIGNNLAYWWPYYGDSVGFVGKVIVEAPPVSTVFDTRFYQPHRYFKWPWQDDLAKVSTANLWPEQKTTLHIEFTNPPKSNNYIYVSNASLNSTIISDPQGIVDKSEGAGVKVYVKKYKQNVFTDASKPILDLVSIGFDAIPSILNGQIPIKYICGKFLQAAEVPTNPVVLVTAICDDIVDQQRAKAATILGSAIANEYGTCDGIILPPGSSIVFSINVTAPSTDVTTSVAVSFKFQYVQVPKGENHPYWMQWNVFRQTPVFYPRSMLPKYDTFTTPSTAYASLPVKVG